MKTVWLREDEGLPVVRRGSTGRGGVLLRGQSLTEGTPQENADYIRAIIGNCQVVIGGKKW